VTRLPQRAARRRADDRGFSLMELIVAMGIFGLLMSILGGVVIEMLKADQSTRARLANVDQVRQGMDAMARNLRTAVRPAQLNSTCTTACEVAFESISSTKVVFHANVGDTDTAGNAAPTLYTYTVAADPDDVLGETARIVEIRQRVAPTWTSGDYTFVPECTVGGAAVSGCTARVLASGIRWPFPSGEKPFAFTSAAGATLAAATDVGNVATVDITLPLGTAANPSPSVASTVFLPNSILGR
jgi:prepilin-type N-terminal cleavage/methylation domain-containing protein